ncbi:MAG TPA: hypothetical protein VGO59_06695 [Verrucomicrobiae bacterium]|jgi:hypothetical protein
MKTLRRILAAGAALGMAGGVLAAPPRANPAPLIGQVQTITAPVATPQPVAPSGVPTVTQPVAAQTVLPGGAILTPAATTATSTGQAAAVFNPATPFSLRPLTSPGGTVFPGTVSPGTVPGRVNGIDTGLFLAGNPIGVSSFGGIFNPDTVFTATPGNVIVTGGVQTGGTVASGVITTGGAVGAVQAAGAAAGTGVVVSTPSGVQAPGAPVIVTGGSTTTVVVPGATGSSVIVTGGQQ